MRLITFFIVLGLFLLTTCKQDHLIQLQAAGIALVNNDGSPLENTLCVSPDQEYAIEIEVKPEFMGGGFFTPITIESMLNGELVTTTFEKPGIKTIPIILHEGNNTASIIDTNISIEIVLILQDDFVLVE